MYHVSQGSCMDCSWVQFSGNKLKTIIIIVAKSFKYTWMKKLAPLNTWHLKKI